MNSIPNKIEGFEPAIRGSFIPNLTPDSFLRNLGKVSSHGHGPLLKLSLCQFCEKVYNITGNQKGIRE